MELKTSVEAPSGRQDIYIVRDFDLPVDLLFLAHTDPELLAQWMGTRVVQLDAHNHGAYHFETSDPQGNVVFRAQGVFHSIIPNNTIIRTFQMENTPFPPQLEFFTFEALTPGTSRLTMQLLFKSPEDREQLLKMPFAKGLSLAHDRLQQVTQQHRSS